MIPKPCVAGSNPAEGARAQHFSRVDRPRETSLSPIRRGTVAATHPLQHGRNSLRDSPLARGIDSFAQEIVEDVGEDRADGPEVVVAHRRPCPAIPSRATVGSDWRWCRTRRRSGDAPCAEAIRCCCELAGDAPVAIVRGEEPVDVVRVGRPLVQYVRPPLLHCTELHGDEGGRRRDPRCRSRRNVVGGVHTSRSSTKSPMRGRTRG